MTDQIEERVKKIVTNELGVEEEKISLESNFTTDLGADSLDQVEMTMALEEEFDITIPDEDAAKIATVGDAVAAIKKHLEEK